MKLAADENFRLAIVSGLRGRKVDVDIARVQDAGLHGADDEAVLDWAASDDRVLLTHDFKTMTRCVFERVARGLKVTGVIEVPVDLPTGTAINDILLIVECCTQSEIENQVWYIPL